MWPQLTNIEPVIVNTINSRANTKVASKLNPWVRIISGAVVNNIEGLVMVSNNDFKLFKAADQNFATIYGSLSESGAIGYDLKNKNAIGAFGEGRAFRPSPIIKSLTSKEGKDQISRELEITLECFTKDQMELLQSFLMEPGYNLCVEWGFNTPNALSQMIDTQQGLDFILNSIADRCLNQNNIHNARKSSAGEYDIFLGFIVGGTVTSDGESFILTVKCKGAPGLPTFLQTHKKTQELDSNGKVIELPTVHPFPGSDLKTEGTDNTLVKTRRFKAMFNSLPAEKQLKEIKDLLNTQEYSIWDFIGFDEVVNEQLVNFESSGAWDFLNFFGKRKIKVGNASLSKEGIFTDYRYISMDLCAKILNRNGGLNTIKLRDKEVKVMIDISNSVIGAFPNMFSIKAEKLIIPGAALPPFRKYFLNSSDVQQQANGKLSDEGPIDYSMGSGGTIRFPSSTALSSMGHTEDANYWGYLKYLYVNFDQVFYPKLNQTNKTIREIFLDILNELSSGVNSFWNFQIVETTVTKDKPVPGLKEGDIVITVIDENWVGKNGNNTPITKFFHSGIKSAFTSADLDISIPQDMTSMLVCKRLALATQPDSAIVNTGELFNSSVDLFMNKVTIQSDDGGSSSEQQNEEITEVEKLSKEEEDVGKQRQALIDRNKQLQQQISAIRAEYSSQGARPLITEAASQAIDFVVGVVTLGTVDVVTDAEEARMDRLEDERDKKLEPLENELKQNRRSIEDLNNKEQEIRNKKEEAIEKAEEDALAAEQAALTKNFEKIAVVPNPLMASVKVNDSLIKDPTIFDKDRSLRIYTLNDGNYFDRLRNDAFNPKGTGNNTRLSHPLPIKYNFTTIGVSGLRRGDMFNIYGIPDKYATHGLFQITQVEHEISGMEWKTSVTGEYRQFNS